MYGENFFYQELIERLEAELDSIEKRAVEIAVEFYAFHRLGNERQKTWQEKSVLFLKVRRRGGSISLEWRRMKWIGKAETKSRRYLLESVYRKVRGAIGYDIRRVRADAREWEKAFVLETELRARKVRKEATACVAVLQKVRQSISWMEAQERKSQIADTL